MIKKLYDMPPWDWPEDAGKTILDILLNENAAGYLGPTPNFIPNSQGPHVQPDSFGIHSGVIESYLREKGETQKNENDCY